MSILFSAAGLVIAILFGLAGYRTGTGMRNRKLAEAITYQGRVQAIYDGMRCSAALSVATLVKRVGLAQSTNYRASQS
ncbi:MAG: hypothetical protein HKM96_05280 [Boseongicola sp.]|nr:hypothetical protein [Boseongicola sp.]